MEKLPKRVTEETIIKAIAETIIVAILAGLGAIWASLKATSTHPGLVLYKEIFLCGSFVFATIVAFLVYRRKRRRHRAKFDAIENDFVVEKLKVRYQWKSPQEIIYSREYRLRALKNDADRFPDKFRWSGNGKPNMKATISGHRIDPHPPESLYDFFDICFDRPYRKGEIINTMVVWQLDDRKCKSRPFISRTLHEPTEDLLMILELPPAWGIESVCVWESPGSGAKKNVKAKNITVTNGRCEWSPEKPLKFMHHYEMRWHWPACLQQSNDPQTHPNQT